MQKGSLVHVIETNEIT